VNEIRRMNLIKTQSSAAPVFLKYYYPRMNKLKIFYQMQHRDLEGLHLPSGREGFHRWTGLLDVFASCS